MFDESSTFSNPIRFPVTTNHLVVAPFWSDNDIRRNGSVKFAHYSAIDAETNSLAAELIANVTTYIQSIREEDNFTGRWLLIAHWEGVHPSPHGGDNIGNFNQNELNQVNSNSVHGHKLLT